MAQQEQQRERRDRIAQWAFDTLPLLNRFHLWLEDVEVEDLRGGEERVALSSASFMDARMERLMTMTTALTALSTKLFGRFGEGADKEKAILNQVKKDADAISAYAMSEGLWASSRLLPENHAIMVCLGEGLMPKAGETPEMGSNPQLGFGRVYARPQVAQWLDRRVTQLLNDPTYTWDSFYLELKRKGITVWGAAIDTLENTSRFAKGKDTGPMAVLHLFDQPLRIMRPYEGYIGNLILPRKVVDKAADRSTLLDFRTPRARVLEAICDAYPGILPEHVHVWTLRGKSREARLGALWQEWTDLGVDLVDESYTMPSGMAVFNDSGTYAPTFKVGNWTDAEGRPHVLVCDGYAASAEAIQAASLSLSLDLDASLVVFTSRFKLPLAIEQNVMRLPAEAEDFAEQLQATLGDFFDPSMVETYREMIREARDAGMPLQHRVVRIEDFFPEKRWNVLALAGYMCPDPYTGAVGVEEVGPQTFRVSVRMLANESEREVALTLRIKDEWEDARLVFHPLLVRFFYGENFRNRPVRISDSGRIRNELQTLCSEALDYTEDGMTIFFDRIPVEVISAEHQSLLLDVLEWYKDNYPMWFRWLTIVPPSQS
ncbi:MAG: hypothetical protein EP343_18905 [Deltaproteobacteria bacterium]|nr:MAG: hypothetical protein EP343_18905 [Deltaproteobacteria bacterium]